MRQSDAFIADDGFVVIFRVRPKVRNSAEHLNAVENTTTQVPVMSYTGHDHSAEAMSAAVSYYLKCMIPAWHKDALCQSIGDTTFFGGEEGEGNQRHRPSLTSKEIKTAKAICAQCPVRAQCLIWSLENNEEFGVWGGVTKRERETFWASVDNPAQTEPAAAPVVTAQSPSIPNQWSMATKIAAV